MPTGLKRYHHTGHSHFITFSCYHRRPYLRDPAVCDALLEALEQTRRRYRLWVYGFVFMPEHVHLLVSEPEMGDLATAVQAFKLASSLRTREMRELSHVRQNRADVGHPITRLWQTRYYDFNIRNYEKFVEKLRYIHRNPVRRGLVIAADDWPWSSFRHYATGCHMGVEIESEWTARERSQTAIYVGNKRRNSFPIGWIAGRPTISPGVGEGWGCSHLRLARASRATYR